jgi:RCC1 and BTB domain-containing protein
MEVPKLSRWPVFSLLSADFLQGVRLAAVFGTAGNEAVVVGRDAEVHALGSNTNSCLGVGDSRSSLQPRRVEALSGKGVVHLAYGSGPHVVALTTGGELYTWGHNGYGQLGLGAGVTTGQGSIPRRVGGGSLSAAKIVSVACGGHHTVAVTGAGEVFSWGYNNCGQLGMGDTVNYTAPERVEGGALGSVTCVSASCGSACSFALSQQGELFCWGYNGNGQLGISNNTNQTLPRRVRLPENTPIVQVVCGYSHTLCLSDEGVLFSWGSNTGGQLGTGNKTNSSTPTPVATDVGRFLEIAAVHNNNVSAASVASGKVFMWGVCRGQNVLSPMETNFSSLDEVFACFASPPCTWKPLSLESDDSSGIVSCIAGRFNDPNTSDLSFVIEGKKIYVHRAILRMRCEYFNSMFQQGRWNESEKDTIEIQQFTYTVYHAFLKYLYTDSVDNLATEETTGLLALSDSYCEKQLKRVCERLLWQSLSVENATSLMTVADKYKAESLQEYCYKFAYQHMTQVALSGGFAELDGALAKQLTVKAAEMGIFKT